MDEQALDVGDSGQERHAPTGRDVSGDVATSDDSNEEYVSLREAREMFLAHGRPVTDRTLQRSCNKQHLVCKKIATADAEKWFALKSSVANRIAELDEFDRLREQHNDATRRDASRHVAPEMPHKPSDDIERPDATEDVSSPVVTVEPSHATGTDQPRPDATRRDVSTVVGDAGMSERERELYDRLVETYQQRIEELAKDKGHLQSDKEALLRQLGAKDRQIDRFFANERDTKTLLGSFQSLVSAIWPGAAKGERYAPIRETLDSGLDPEAPPSDDGAEPTDR